LEIKHVSTQVTIIHKAS